MCRFIAYTGNPILLDEVLFKPKNSLIKQSIHAREAKEPLNGDGFGLGWYVSDISNEPGVFVSTQPAWNDQNLAHLSSKIRSGCFFAHVRAASHGGVSKFNCHPFRYKQLLFMHNGGLGGFTQIKRAIRKQLSDPIYSWVSGQTDSEHFLALLLQTMAEKDLNYDLQGVASAFEMTLLRLIAIQKSHDIKEVSHINVVMTEGSAIVAMRCLLNPGNYQANARTLYYARASELKTIDGICRMSNEGEKYEAVLVVSEKLNNHKADWQLVPINTLLQIGKDYTVTLKPLSL